MNDTADAVSAMVAQRHAAMTPEQRCRAASRMFDDARILVRSSLDSGVPAAERWLAEMRRLYGSELPHAAMAAFAARAAGSTGPDGALDLLT
jgi:hypothetical protein